MLLFFNCNFIHSHILTQEHCKFITQCQKGLAKYFQLRAVNKKKGVPEFAYHLIQIWLHFGAPHAVQSESGRKLTV